MLKRAVLVGAALVGAAGFSHAKPFAPAGDEVILASLPAGAHHADTAVRRMARERQDVALPLAQFYIGQARATGDLRFLGFADAVLTPWTAGKQPLPAALVLQATVQQSRHEFTRSLATLDTALHQSQDPQAWLTRATVLRVLGRFDEAEAACAHFATQAGAADGVICREGLQGLSGHLESAYATLEAQVTQGMTDTERAWRATELGDMAVRLGREPQAERWYRVALSLEPRDLYVRAALADLLLRVQRAQEVPALLAGRESIEPLLLRLAIAQKRSGDPAYEHSRELLRAAFEAEAARGEPVHGREQARFLVEVDAQPQPALRVALANWSVQHEPDDVLVLVAAAQAAGEPGKAAPAREFVRMTGLQDARL